MTTIPFFSQIKSLFQLVTGDASGAKKTQEEFLDAWEHHPLQTIGDFVDGVPIVGHVKGMHLEYSHDKDNCSAQKVLTFFTL